MADLQRVAHAQLQRDFDVNVGLEFPSEQFTLGTDSCIEPIEVAVQSAHASPVGLKCARHLDADLVGLTAGVIH